MSYEGRWVFMCENGHVTETDVHDPRVEDFDNGPTFKQELSCESCDKKMIMVGGIDDTNGYSAASFYFKRKQDPQMKRCESCGTHIVTSPATYELVRPGVYGYYTFTELHPVDDFKGDPEWTQIVLK